MAVHNYSSRFPAAPECYDAGRGSTGMNREERWVATWQRRDGRLRAYEPTAEVIASTAPALAAFYNNEYNRSMMANTVAMSAAEVVEPFEWLRHDAGKPFQPAQEPKAPARRSGPARR